MKILILEKATLDAVAYEASDVLSRGGIILYPTDTIYGLGCDALSDTAVKKIYTLKGRVEEKNMSCMVSDRAHIEKLGVITRDSEILAKHFLPGALTLVLSKHDTITSGIAHGRDTIGVRIPNHPFSLSLAYIFGKPITVTSANISGMPTEHTVEKILAQFGNKADLIDLVIDAGTLPSSVPSTVVDCTVSPPRILREGAISSHDIFAVLHKE